MRDTRWDLVSLHTCIVSPLRLHALTLFLWQRTFTNISETPGVSQSLIVMTESGDVTNALLKDVETGLMAAFKDGSDQLEYFESLVVTDMPAREPEEECVCGCAPLPEMVLMSNLFPQETDPARRRVPPAAPAQLAVIRSRCRHRAVDHPCVQRRRRAVQQAEARSRRCHFQGGACLFALGPP